MKFNLELEHPELSRVRYVVNNEQISDDTVTKIWNADINIVDPVRVELWFWPWKTAPLLRVNGHLINYGLARVDQFDHALCFELQKDFFDIYGQSLVASRVYSQFKNDPIDDKVYDAVIGYGRRHTELIDSIKRIVES